MGKGSNTSSTNSATYSSADPQAAAQYRAILDRAAGVAATPYQAYQGPLTATTNAQQNLGIAGINANAGYANPFIQQAANQATASSGPISGGDIQRYLNPYTQSVVDATTAQLRNEFGQQHAQLQGNQIAQGALGGNATGVAKGILGGQQARQLASTTANLYSQGYQQALDAAQRQQATGITGANAIANYGIAGQQAALQGASSQFGVGTQQQGITQADYDRMYQQYAQAQAFPYQQAQWLAGMSTGVGSNLGGYSSSSGQTTGPQPNQTGQWLGAGLTAASMFLSDRRAKEDIERVGELDDGTPIYRYRYKGSPELHIGPMAQEVDQEHVARGFDGMRYMDLEGVTDDAIERAAGGGVQAPWGGIAGQGWIPTIGITAGSGAPRSSGQAPSLPKESGGMNPEALAKGIVGLGGKLQGMDWGGAWDAGIGNLSGDAWGGGSFWKGDQYGGSSAAPLAGLDASDYGVGFARGGGIAGDPSFDERFSGLPRVMDSPDTPVAEFGEGGLDDGMEIESHRAQGVINPGNPHRLYGSTFGPEPPPAVAADDDDEIPVNAAPARGIAPVVAFEDSEHYRGLPDATARPQERRGFGLGLLSPNAQTGLMAAGLGMMASRSPFLGNVVGEGGIAGLRTYGNAEQQDRETAAEAAKLARELRKDAYGNWMGERKQTEVERHNRVAESNEGRGAKLPALFTRTADGRIELAPGAEDATKRLAAARKGAGEGEPMSQEAIKMIADRVRAGDQKAVVGFGRGAQGAADLRRVHEQVAKDAAEGKPVDPAARSILQNAAQQAGLMAAERRQATIMANLSVYGRTAFKATDIALRLSNEVARTQWQPINKVLLAAKEKTGDPKVVAFGMALQTLTNEYARAIGGGHGTVHDKEEAEKKLNRAQTPQQLEAIIEVMRAEILAEESAMPEARKHIRDIYNPGAEGPTGHSVAGEHGRKPPPGPVPGASGFSPPPGAIARTYNGRTYYYEPNTKQPYPGQ